MPLTYHFWFVCTLHMLDCFTCKVKYQLWKEICLNNNPNGKNVHSASSPPPPPNFLFPFTFGFNVWPTQWDSCPLPTADLCMYF